MKAAAILLAMALPFGASAQMYDEPTCYSWNGGHKSSGSFSKCPPPWIIAKELPKAAPLPPPVQPSPIMMPQSAPITCAPPPKPVFKKKHKPPVKC